MTASSQKMRRALTASAIAAISPMLPTTHDLWLTTRCATRSQLAAHATTVGRPSWSQNVPNSRSPDRARGKHRISRSADRWVRKALSHRRASGRFQTRGSRLASFTLVRGVGRAFLCLSVSPRMHRSARNSPNTARHFRVMNKPLHPRASIVQGLDFYLNQTRYPHQTGRPKLWST